MPDLAKLVLNYDDLSSKVNALYAEMRRSPAKRDLFIQNPAAVISARILDGKDMRNPVKIDAINRVIFSLLSNPKFYAWIRSYENRIFDELRKAGITKNTPENRRKALLILGKQKIFRDMAEGIAEFGDPELFRALIASDQAQRMLSDGALAAGLIGPILIVDSVFIINSAIAINSVFITHSQVFTDQETVFHQGQNALFHQDQQQDQIQVQDQTQINFQTQFQDQVQDELSLQTQDQIQDQTQLSEADAVSEAEALAEAEAIGIGLTGIFGLSRPDLQQFAGILAVAMANYAVSVRESGQLTGDATIEAPGGE